MSRINLPRWGHVVEVSDVVRYSVLDSEGDPIEPVQFYLRDFKASGNRDASVRSYAYDLLRWWRFLRAVGVDWDRATPAEGRDFVLWLLQARKPIAERRKQSAIRAGTVNPVTRKQYPGDSYMPRTIRHSNAVVRSFYTFWAEQGMGPVANPIPVQRTRSGDRPNAHHNPLERFRPEGKLRYNPRVPKRKPRAMSDDHWDALFGSLSSDRDRAVLALAISTAARAGELVRLRGGDIDWGDQLIRVRRKGTDAEQWLAASPEAFVWLRLYLTQTDPVRASDPLWWTLRRRDQGDGESARIPLNYDALRAVLRRVNDLLGSNWSMHDLRHTCALRMIRDKNLSMRDVQTALGHAALSTTQTYLEEEDTEVIRRVRRHLQDREKELGNAPLPAPAGPGYDATDLAVLFGTDR
ncbi:tyrosine-type recombinase/integrase [Streptomyces varsoviensis]|uniref:tyrosine-type recombinase/integrase n=1 Tax=Streptomyces varsoviensis TaxID=67373 RepID=UPI0033D2DDA6